MYSILPYYEMVKKYSDLENRDIWEYELNLDRMEIRRLVIICLGVAAGLCRLLFHRRELLIPTPGAPGSGAATTRSNQTLSVVGHSSRYRAECHRAERATCTCGLPPLGARRRRLSPQTANSHKRGLAYDLALGKRAPDDPELAKLSPERRAALLKSAYEYLQYRFLAGSEKRDLAAPRLLALLRARSEIPGKADVPPAPQPQTRPDQGHGSTRAAFGIGSSDGKDFLELRLRPALHDLLDPQGGFLPGTEINSGFGSALLREP